MAKKKVRDDDRPKRVEPVKRDGAYVMMLFVTLVAIATGCVLLYLDFDEYGGKTAPATPAPAVLKLGEAPPKEAAPPAPAPAPAPADPMGGMPPAPMGGMGMPMGMMPPMPE